MQCSLKASEERRGPRPPVRRESQKETSAGSDQQQKKSRRDVQEREQRPGPSSYTASKDRGVCAIDDEKGGVCAVR